MADFNDPISGHVGDVGKALDALEARILAAKARVAEIESSAGGARAGGAAPTGAKAVASTEAATTVGKEYRKVLADIERIQQTAAGRTAIYSDELRRQIQLYGTSSQALRKHGALTTEFLGEAAKGRVTLSELRYQVGATIAKFAGWTAAAASVYAVVGALREVGSGAVSASTGVNQLQRVLFSRSGGPSPVNRTQAIEGFRRYSAQFNLPIEDVASAQYQIGKVFQSQEGSYKATAALLYAVKVGELDVVDASRLLISTVNAFGLQFDDLLPLMDKYNSLQNGMGVATRDTAAGVAKAAGQWRAAGGSLRYLVSLVGAGTKVTGLSGDQFGTLLQRSAGLTQRPQNQQQLRSFGIDPRQNIEGIIRDAFKVAQTLPRRDLLHLAQALSTPQLAPRFTALLGRPDIVSRAERLTDPRIATGSSARELATVLNGFQERMRRITNDLQQVGAAGAVSGALIVPGAALSGLDHALRLLSDVGGAFSHLNPELRAAVAVVTQLTILMRILRRFNVGDTFAASAPTTAGLFRQSPERRARGLIGGALDRETTFYTDEREKASFAAATARRRALAQAAAQDALLARGPQQFAGPGVSQKQAVKRYRDVAAAQEAAVIESDRVAVAAANEEANLRGEIAAAQARSLAFQQEVIRGNKTAVAFAAENNIFFPPHLGLPTVDPLVDPKAAAQNIPPPTFAQRLDSRGRDFVTKARPWNAALDRVPGAMTAVETAGLAGVAAMSRSAAAIAASKNVLLEVGGGLRALAGSLIAGLLSPVGLLITATTALPIVIDYINERNKHLQAELDRTKNLKVTPIRTADLPKTAQQQYEAAHKSKGFIEKFLDFSGKAFPVLPVITGQSGPSSEQKQRDAAAAAYQEIDRRYRAIREARAFGRPAPGLPVSDIIGERDRAIDGFRKSASTKSEREKALARILREYDLSLEATRGSEKDLELLHRSSAKTRREFADVGKSASPDLYAGLGIGDIQKRIENYITIAQSGKNVGGNFAKALQALHVARTSVGPRSDPQNIADVLGIQSTLANGINDQAKQELDQSLAFAKTNGQRRAAYRRYESTLRRRLVADPRKSLRDAQDAAAAADQSLASAEKDLGELAGRRRVSPRQLGATQTRVRRLKLQDQARHKDVQVAKQIEEAFAQFFQIFFAGIQQDLASLADTQSQDAEALGAAQDSLYVAGASNPLDKAKRNVDVLYRKLNRQKSGKHTAADLVQTHADILNAQHDLADQIVSDARDLINAQAAYAAAGTDDPYKAAVIESRRAHRILNRGGFKTQAERVQAQADARRADRDKLKSRQQEAYDDIQFLADVGKISREEEIRRLQHLQSTIKKNKDLKRQIQREIYSLQHQDEGSLDLDVGNIRLPNLYDVRRLIASGASGGPVHQYHVQQSFHMEVATGADVDEVFAHAGAYVGAGGRAQMRSAGLI